MAIYHFSAKVISRAAGSSAVAAAACRSASRLPDERLGRDHDFSRKAGVVHSEVLLPDGAPEMLADRSTLWNAVEAGEVRRDAQLAREVEFAIPRELNEAQGVELAREFVQREFVDCGMVADLNVHWDLGADGLCKPHAHVMLTLREVDESGFGKKARDWNRTELLQGWREAWADHVNGRLAELDVEARVNYRSFEAQELDLEPQHKIGPARERREARGDDAERAADHRRIARENGARIIADPTVALEAITQHQATFSARDLAAFVHRHSDGKDQLDRALSAVRTSTEIVNLGYDDRGGERFTYRAMIHVEARLEQFATKLVQRQDHAVEPEHQRRALAAAADRGLILSGEQRQAFAHVTGKEGLAAVVGYAGSGKSAMLGVAREAWEASGYTVRGAALSGIATENLESGSGIESRTIASLEHQWSQGREMLTAADVLVVDEAGMIGTRQLERVISQARNAGAKVVLVGDPEQLQAIEAGAAFRTIAERHGAVEITAIRRQREDWQRDATKALATGSTEEAIQAYGRQGCIHDAPTRDQARDALVERWDTARSADPQSSRIILTHTNAEVAALNALARERLRDAGELGIEVNVQADRGSRAFAPGDRLMFLKNERSLGVKNGTLGTVETATSQRMSVTLDDGRAVAFDLKDYAHVDHGYAATIHKAQGVTVDQAHVLATPGLDRHGAYVALSRHRDRVDLHCGRDDFATLSTLKSTLSRARTKDMASDWIDGFAERRGIEPPSLADKARAFGEAVRRHAKVVLDLFKRGDQNLPDPPQAEAALKIARRDLNVSDGWASHHMETAYANRPTLATEAAGGKTGRAIQAMQLEAELRVSPDLRADKFVERWQKLDAQKTLAYQQGQMTEMRRIRDMQGAMATSLERDPQVESLLTTRKQALGLVYEQDSSLGKSLAMSIGYGMGRGRGARI